MATDLHEGLRRLADEQPIGKPSADLWTRGLRRSRRRRAAGALGAVAAAVIAVLVLLSVDTSLVAKPTPAPVDVPASRLHLPDRIFAPSRWMAGTDGPPGPLAVLSEAKRASSWFGTSSSWFGISAADGSYHWVSLPHIDPRLRPVLSPDGTKIGYALAGQPSGRSDSQAVGFAIYDTTTGRVRTWRIPTRHGLAVDVFPDRAGWTPDSHWFAVYYGQLHHHGAESDGYRTLAFPTNGRPFLTLPARSPGRGFGLAGRHSITWVGSEGGQVHVAAPGTKPRSFAVQPVPDGGPWISPDGQRFVVMATGPTDGGGSTDRFYVGHVPPPGRVAAVRQLHLLNPVQEGIGILGWRDAEHVLVDSFVPRKPGDRFPGTGPRLAVINVRTDAVHEAIRRPAVGELLSEPQVAAQLLSHRLVPGVRPPDGVDPRLPAGGAAGILVLTVLGIRFWRRHAGA